MSWSIIAPNLSGYYYLLNTERDVEVVYRDAKRGTMQRAGDEVEYDDHRLTNELWWSEPISLPAPPMHGFAPSKVPSPPNGGIAIKLKNATGKDLPAYTRVRIAHRPKEPHDAAESIVTDDHTGLVAMCQVWIAKNSVGPFLVFVAERSRK